MKDSQKVLNRIHKLASENDHLKVIYYEDKLFMANEVINQMRSKLNQIADIAEDGCSV